jgi:hypothetical protein
MQKQEKFVLDNKKRKYQEAFQIRKDSSICLRKPMYREKNNNILLS